MSQYTKPNNTTSGLAGAVEIVNVRRSFYTSSFGSPDLLFTWLLSNARDAFRVAASSSVSGINSTRSSPNRSAELYMAGLLLCDGKFMPANLQTTYDHYYQLDFQNSAIQLRTQVYAVGHHSASFFTIRIDGGILESTFVARHSVTNRILARISEEEMRKADFFNRELPFICSQSQLDPNLVGLAESADLEDHAFELRFQVDVDDTLKTLALVKKKGAGEGLPEDPETGEVLFKVPLSSFKNIGAILQTLPLILRVRKKQLDNRIDRGLSAERISPHAQQKTPLLLTCI